MTEEKKSIALYFIWLATIIFLQLILMDAIIPLRLGLGWIRADQLDVNIPDRIRIVYKFAYLYREHGLLYTIILLIFPIMPHYFFKKNNILKKYTRLLLILLAVLWGCVGVATVILLPMIPS